MKSHTPDKRFSLFTICLLVVMPIYAAKAQEYKIPDRLEKIAQRYNAKELLIKGVNYRDLLAAANVVANRRAIFIGREVKDEDYEFALATWCIPIPNYPKEPPKPPKPEEEKELKEKLKRLMRTAATDQKARAAIRNSLRIDVLMLPKEELRRRQLTVAAVFGEKIGPLPGNYFITGLKPNITIAPAPVPYKKGNVYISGSGFKPKQELGIRVMLGGVLSDISFLVKPRPIANKFGAFSSVWKLNREIRRKLLKANTAYTVTIVDEDGNTVGTAPLVFDKAKKKKKPKKRK